MSSKLPALTDLAGAQLPTDEMYVVRPGLDPLGSFKSFLNDLFEQPPKNITDGVMKGIQGTGVDGIGFDLGLSGGRGTGAAVPGVVSIRYPLIRASGATPQTLSSDLHLPPTNQYTTVGVGTSINSTAAETSLFTGLTASNGSTRVIEGGIARLGTCYRVRIVGNISSNGAQTIQTKIKLGATTILDTGAAAINTAGGRFWIDIDLNVPDNDATGLVTVFMRFDYSSANTGAATVATINGANGPLAIDFTANQQWDITIQFGAASAANSIQVFNLTIDRIR